MIFLQTLLRKSKRNELKLLSLVLAEPIGGAAPKFSTDSKSLGTFEKVEGGTLALLCPAQAMPLPSYRSVDWSSQPPYSHLAVQAGNIIGNSLVLNLIYRADRQRQAQVRVQSGLACVQGDSVPAGSPSMSSSGRPFAIVQVGLQRETLKFTNCQNPSAARSPSSPLRWTRSRLRSGWGPRSRCYAPLRARPFQASGRALVG